MILIRILYAMGFLCNSLLISASLFSPIKEDTGSMRIFNDPRAEFEYVIKRHSPSDVRLDSLEEPDTKKDDQKGTTFIRFGRDNNGGGNGGHGGHGGKNKNVQLVEDPSIYIRFGRSGHKGIHKAARMYERNGRSDPYIRYGRSLPLPTGLDVSLMCSDIFVGEEVNNQDLRNYLAKLARFCNVLNAGVANNDDDVVVAANDSVDEQRE